MRFFFSLSLSRARANLSRPFYYGSSPPSRVLDLFRPRRAMQKKKEKKHRKSLKIDECIPEALERQGVDSCFSLHLLLAAARSR